MIYANQGLRATVSALKGAYKTITTEGKTISLEDIIASVKGIFELQNLKDWKSLEEV